MNNIVFKNWYQKRGPRFIWHRGADLLKRYHLRPEKAIDRIKDCVAEMIALGCAPTFPTPGIIVQRFPKFIRSLQDAGVEIAVHGYYHINLTDLSVESAVNQLLRAVHTFEHFGIDVHGFRCPYIGYSDELQDSLPTGVFEYSSNQSIYWDVFEKNGKKNNGLFFDILDKFYNGTDSSLKISLPWMCSDMVEIPVCVPDDLQLHDGLKLDSSEIAHTWNEILHQTYLRGELFTLLFHTELASLCKHSIGTLIHRAQQYQPEVWVAKLQEVSDWWREKSKFKVEITPMPINLRLNFECTPRATILVRGLSANESAVAWDGEYQRLHSKVLEVPTNPRPFVGVAATIEENTVSFLRNQGYILDTGKTAKSCGIYLDENVISKLTSEVELVNFIESSPAPLVRFWRWPDGRKSALCITGDLDALTLFDYASRIFFD